ncbi:hypothetical protein Fmac_001355 [Flemingia macrophylla]|uniref:Uncharacterized protein n=1 Tax=Flemingia macrophylla TaxID=520843 RepID=A0ABD1NGU7_9FABA
MEPQLLNCHHPSLVFVLEPSFHVESCESSFSADVISTEVNTSNGKLASKPATFIYEIFVYKLTPSRLQGILFKISELFGQSCNFRVATTWTCLILRDDVFASGLFYYLLGMEKNLGSSFPSDSVFPVRSLG